MFAESVHDQILERYDTLGLPSFPGLLPEQRMLWHNIIAVQYFPSRLVTL
jgi:hypothetical protein